jgi:hypothetical protein
MMSANTREVVFEPVSATPVARLTAHIIMLLGVALWTGYTRSSFEGTGHLSIILGSILFVAAASIMAVSVLACILSPFAWIVASLLLLLALNVIACTATPFPMKETGSNVAILGAFVINIGAVIALATYYMSAARKVSS